jgi:hypothetical protein
VVSPVPVLKRWAKICSPFGAAIAGSTGRQKTPAFLCLTTPEESTAAYVQASEDQFSDPEYSLRVRRDGPRIPLPSPDVERLRAVSLWDSLKARKSSRTFDGTPVSLVEISTLLHATFGEVHGPWTHLTEHGLRELGIRRTSPSGTTTKRYKADAMASLFSELGFGLACEPLTVETGNRLFGYYCLGKNS